MIIRRRGTNAEARLLSADEFAIYRAIANPVSLPRAAEISKIAPNRTTAILERLHNERLVLSMSGLWLALAQPTGVDAWVDAGLPDTASAPPHLNLFATEKSHDIDAAAAVDGAHH